MTRLLREPRASRFAWLAEPRAVRGRWLATLSRMLDSSLRSRLFLVCMRYGLATSFEVQTLHGGAHRRPSARRRGPPRG